MYQHIAVSAGPFQARSAGSGPVFFDGVLDPWQELSGPINLAFWGFVLCILKDKSELDCGRLPPKTERRRRDLSWSWFPADVINCESAVVYDP